MSSGDARTEKACASLIFLIFAATSLAYHVMGSFYPVITISGILVGIVFLSIVMKKRNGLHFGLMLALLISIALYYQLGIFLLSPSLIDVDPQAYAVQAQWVMETGTTAELTGFYQTAALFNVLTASVGIVAGLRADHALVIYPLVLSVLIPLLLIGIIHRIRIPVSSRFTIGLAGAIAVSAQSMISYGFSPRPQIYTLPFFALLILSMMMYFQTRSPPLLVVMGVFLSGLIFAHKLPVFLFFLVMAVATLMFAIFNKTKLIDTSLTRLTILAGLGLVLQWIYITVFLEEAVDYAREVGRGPTALDQAALQSSHAVPVVASGTTQVINNSDLIIILVAFGASLLLCLYLWQSTFDWGLLLVLSTTALLSFFVVLGSLTAAFGRGRFLIYVELFLAIVIGLAAAFSVSETSRGWPKANRTRITVQLLVFGLVLLVIVTQFAVLPLGLDHPENSRMYLTEDEIAAKDFEAKHVPNVVYSDRYYANFVVDPRRPVAEGDHIQMRQVPQPHYPGIMDAELRNATLIENQYQYVTHRHNIEIFWLEGTWRLTWDPAVALEREYSEVYDNGSVSTYAYPS